jgi:Carboxypeptidase regulatory-like domain
VRLRLATLILATFWARDFQASTCVAPKPLKTSAPVCGKVFDPIGAPVPNAELLLADANGTVVSRVRADSNADFAFPPVPKGKYRIDTDAPYRMAFGAIQITGTKQTGPCKRPVFVYLGVGDCSGGVSRTKPGR